ncbi:hypothetical protein FVR03_07240 [Pontibacter qinzhouensis]|uniref:Tetratricopeptide repeat protein n=1 Tax=Pontibacter qinzhouensis TaxID=2603253 RepID=A0A5C8KBC9_9BACT|nr:hypothetical protein [Pontibacter qinzhouensis]TXK49004.1 hypothetical protein FVR03_07240 [Pontibacter qinzhouensis]
MNLTTFKESLSATAPPAGISVYLQALWFDAKGNWEKAHVLVQALPDKNAAWIHAYLHRKEGDAWNADYWYRRASKTRPAVTLEEEWEGLLKVLL